MCNIVYDYLIFQIWSMLDMENICYLLMSSIFDIRNLCIKIHWKQFKCYLPMSCILDIWIFDFKTPLGKKIVNNLIQYYDLEIFQLLLKFWQMNRLFFFFNPANESKIDMSSIPDISKSDEHTRCQVYLTSAVKVLN